MSHDVGNSVSVKKMPGNFENIRSVHVYGWVIILEKSTKVVAI